jgi:hypothetical protein
VDQDRLADVLQQLSSGTMTTDAAMQAMDGV